MEKQVMCVSNDNKNVSPLDTIDAIKKAGYQDVFIQWYDKDYKDFEVSEQEQLDYIRQVGLNVAFAHLGYKGINDIWLNVREGEELVKKYLRNIDEMHQNGIDLVVMHLVNGLEAPTFNSLGLKRFKTICDYAMSKGIKVAFENTKISGYQEAILDNIDNPNVGICFDSGHFHCHFKDQFDFERFKDKIMCVHIHDNFGIKDEHLVPFDGTLDYDLVLNGLREANYQGDMTLELCYRNDYLNMSVDEFYAKGYEVGKKLIRRYGELE